MRGSTYSHLACFLCGVALAYVSCQYLLDRQSVQHSGSSPLDLLNAFHVGGGDAAGSRNLQAAGSSSSSTSASLPSILISSGNGSSSSSAAARHLLYQGGNFLPAWRQEYGEFKSRWHPTVLGSVFKAQQMLRTSREQRASRLFVPILSNRHAELCCMLTDFDSKVGATNPADVFVFTVDNKAQQVWNRSPCWRRKLNITVVFLALDEHWGLPDPASSSSAYHNVNDWTGMPGLFGESYRKMGHWRLTFQFAFADMLGYKYVWQLDDDSFFRSPVNMSMVGYMQQHQLWVAGAKSLPDPHWVTWGLPEIARLFLVSGRLTPPGTLFSNHTTPPGLEGLYTVRNNTVRTKHPLEGDPGGWSRSIIHGNCLIVDMDKFWWPNEHQKFLELVLQTGYHWRFRWNEQGVIAMLWQIFVPPANFQVDTLPIDYHHPRKSWGACPDGAAPAA